MRKSWLMVVGLGLTAATACAMAQPTVPRDMRVNSQVIDARANALAASGDPKDLLAAGYWLLLSGSGAAGTDQGGERDRQASRWIKRAAIEGAGDARLAKIALLLCLGDDKPGCEVAPAILTAKTLSADDMLVQLYLWRHATFSEDTRGAEEAFDRFMAATRYVDDSTHDMMLLTRAMNGVEAVSPLSALSEGMLAETDIEADLAPLANAAMAWGLVNAMPYTYFWHQLDDECPKSGEVVARMFEKCREILLAMTEARSIAEVLFSHSRVLVYARSDAERNAWETKRGQVLWVLEQLGDRASPAKSSKFPVKASEYWLWMMDVGEWEAARRLLQRSGSPEQPPKGWKPSRDYDA